MYFFSEYSSRSLFFCKKTILKIKVTVWSTENIFFFLKGKKKTVVSMFCASNQVKCLESDRKCVFCSYRIWNKQFSRKKALLKAWIRQESCVKPLATEYNGLMRLNSCLFKIPRSNIYINLKETDILHYFCFTWNNILVKCLNSAVVSRETKSGKY